MQMSLHFRKALADNCLLETIDFLNEKRLFDKKVASLTDIIHPSLSDSLRKLKAHMSAVKGPTQVAVINGWTSSFPCFGIGINRTTGLHRDTRGIRGGLDIIGVLGTFTEGGDLELPDLNLRLEWRPGCLGAFDGYDFRHKVNSWTGGSRVTLIYFCRRSTWSALGLDSALSRPTIAVCRDRLSSAKCLRAEAVAEAVAKERAGQGKRQARRDVPQNNNKDGSTKSAVEPTRIRAQGENLQAEKAHRDIELERCVEDRPEAKKRRVV